MKLIIVLSTLIWAQFSFGADPCKTTGRDLGQDLQALEAKYGASTHPDGPYTIFSPSSDCVVKVIFLDGKASGVIYEKKGLTKEEASSIYDRNSINGIRMERGRTQRQQRSMFRDPLTGRPYIESFQSRDTTSGILSDTVVIGNEYPAPKGWNAFQIRNAKQFKLDHIKPIPSITP
jgi:hypothetical protein